MGRNSQRKKGKSKQCDVSKTKKRGHFKTMAACTCNKYCCKTPYVEDIQEFTELGFMEVFDDVDKWSCPSFKSTWSRNQIAEN